LVTADQGHRVAGHFKFGQGADRYFDFDGDDDEGYRGWNTAIVSSRLRLGCP